MRTRKIVKVDRDTFTTAVASIGLAVALALRASHEHPAGTEQQRANLADELEKQATRLEGLNMPIPAAAVWGIVDGLRHDPEQLAALGE